MDTFNKPNDELKYHKLIYADLDSLLDIRQGALTHLDVAVAVDITSIPPYYLREEDSFVTKDGQKLTYEKFKAFYETARFEGVSCSVMTKIPMFIADLVERAIRVNAAIGIEMVLGLEVNTYPYPFDEEDRAGLQDTLTLLYEGRMKVNVIHVDPKTISIKDANERYLGMVMYDYADFINANEENFKKHKTFGDVTLYCPRLFLAGLPPKKDLEEYARQKKDPFDLWDMALAPHVKINYLPVAFFCCATPANTDDYTTELN